MSRGAAASIQQQVVEGMSTWLWDPVVMSVLTAPTWVVFGVLGAVLILLGRRRKPLIGYARG